MVRKTIRIYKYHDIDLFYLAENYNFNFQKAIYCAIRAYLKKESAVIVFPEKRAVPLQIPRKSVSRVLRFDESKDKDILEFIDKIPEGQMNGVVKNILRAYLCRPVMGAWAEEYNEIFIKGKREIRAAGYDKKKRKETTNKNPKKSVVNKTTEPVPQKKIELFSNLNAIEEKNAEIHEQSSAEGNIQNAPEDIDDVFLTNAFSSFFD